MEEVSRRMASLRSMVEPQAIDDLHLLSGRSVAPNRAGRLLAFRVPQFMRRLRAWAVENQLGPDAEVEIGRHTGARR